MFSSGPNYTKLKTNLKLSVNRLKLLEKKKAELAQKSRKEIADYLATGKTERARIRIEHIIREDYLVEAMEIVEMFCDLLLARFGLVTQMKELDEGIAEAVYSLIWVCPRLQSDVPELKVIADICSHKYGPQFAEQARTATGNHHVSEKLMQKLQLQAPPKLLVEQYLVEIAKNFNVAFEPDPQVMADVKKGEEPHLIDLSGRNNLGRTDPPPAMGFINYPSVPPLPMMPDPPTFNYPPPFGGPNNGGGGGSAAGFNPAPSPFHYNIPPNAQNKPSTSSNMEKDLNTNFIERQKMQNDLPPRYSSIDPNNFQDINKPKAQPRTKLPSPQQPRPSTTPTAPPPVTDIPSLPNDLPDVPDDNDKSENDEIDFDDLSRRFENLKKRK